MLVYSGHRGPVRSISVSPNGQWLASGAEDRTVRIWELATGRCVRVFGADHAVCSIAWNPTGTAGLLAVAADTNVAILHPRLGGDPTDDVLERTLQHVAAESSTVASVLPWITSVPAGVGGGDNGAMLRMTVRHGHAADQVVWHAKGDYFATVCPEAPPSRMVLIHQLSTRRTQAPFRKPRGLVQRVQFHPTRPFFFVLTQRHLRVYDLQKLELLRKLQPGVKWANSIDVHPLGDNLLLGSYDRRVCWFDLDLGLTPYKMLQSHRSAVRAVAYCRRHPLFASCSDDGSLHVFHGTVFSDLLQNPLIVPVRVLTGHRIVDGRGVLDCVWHPTQPWLLSAGADATVRLYT